VERGQRVVRRIEPPHGWQLINVEERRRFRELIYYVGDVDALLALGVSLNKGAVGVQNRQGEDLRRLLGPDLLASPVDGVHQDHDVGLTGAAAEVAGGRGVADALGAQTLLFSTLFLAALWLYTQKNVP